MSLGIADAQSVKNTESARNKGYNMSKKASDIKRHVVVDTNGLPHAIAVTTANVTDRNGEVSETLEELRENTELEFTNDGIVFCEIVAEKNLDGF